MRRLFTRLRCNQEGSVVPLVAISMTCLMGLVALGVDVGLLYMERSRLHNVADIAALTAVQHLPDDPVSAYLAAREYLQKNGYNPDLADVTVDPIGRTVAVGAGNTVDLIFARVLGRQQQTVYGGSSATIQSISGVFGAVPLGVAQADWQMYDPVILKLSANDGTVSPGNYQALALGKSGASMYEMNLMNGYQDWIRVGQWLDTETGNMANPTVRAIKYRIDSDPLATYTDATKGSPRLVPIPVLRSFEVNGKGQVEVVGFGMFFLESVAETGSDKAEITGRFVRMLAEGEANGTAPDFGLSRAKLIQ
ncbi:MAG: pilus assembly protein TadG-related protein [Bacillota bacterium]